MSDLHGRLPEIPDCDVLFLAGDICPDIERVGWDADLMRLGQSEWLGNTYYDWEQSVPAKQIHATPGNHDWVGRFPAHCRSVMHVDELVELGGKKIWFTPWVSPCGPWNYQQPRDQRALLFADIPHKLDLLVMHAPAHGCGDTTYGGDLAGCPEMRAIIQKRQPRHVVFGHIHEGSRYGRSFRLGGSILYNVAVWGDWTPRVFEI